MNDTDIDVVLNTLAGVDMCPGCKRARSQTANDDIGDGGGSPDQWYFACWPCWNKKPYTERIKWVAIKDAQKQLR
jgi:hypothetical protein